MQCALIAAAATFGGPILSVATSRGCEAGSIVTSLSNGDYLGLTKGVACSYFSEVFATGVGIVVAGATAETGPGAVAIGVTAYRALAAGLKIACSGLLDGGAKALGVKLESRHETNVALDIERKNKCLRMKKLAGVRTWSATSCS
jgi:hypothetical protein